MKSLKEHLSEALRSPMPKRFHADTYKKAEGVGREIYAGIASDLHQGYESTKPRNAPHEDSFYSNAAAAIAGHLYDYHRQNPEHLGSKFSPEMATHIAKKIAGDTEGDDRKEHRAALTAHYATQRRKAAIERVKGEREDFKTAIAGRPTETLQSDINLHKDLATTYKDKDPKAASHHRFMVRAHTDELKSRAANPNSRPSTKPTSVNVYTNSGTVQRKMKLPPFRKA